MMAILRSLEVLTGTAGKGKRPRIIRVPEPETTKISKQMYLRRNPGTSSYPEGVFATGAAASALENTTGMAKDFVLITPLCVNDTAMFAK